MSLGEIREGCVPGGSVTDGRGCDPTWIVVCPGASQQLTDGWGQIFPKMATSRDRQLLNIPVSFVFNVLPSQQATFAPVFPGGPPRTAVRFDPDSHGDFVLPWDPGHVKVHVCLLRMGSPFPPVLWSYSTQAPLTFNARCSGGSFSQCQIPTRRSLMWGSELSLL